MDKDKLNLRPVATVNLENAFSRVSLALEWPLAKLTKNRIAYKLYYYLISLSAYGHSTGRPFISDRKWSKNATRALSLAI